MKLMKILSSLAVLLMLAVGNSVAGNADHPDDSHYTDSGFFDIHICNWPNRKPFYLALYSTRQFKALKSVDLLDTKGEKFASLDLSKYKVVNFEGKAEKRIYMTQIPRPVNYSDGWFSAKISLGDKVHTAQDWLEHGVLPRAKNLQPANGEELTDLPKVLRWSAIEGAQYYMVFIKDIWGRDELIFTSDLLTETELVLPEDLLEYGGFYSWRVHARDINGDIKLGDFNIGSLTSWQQFTIAD